MHSAYRSLNTPSFSVLAFHSHTVALVKTFSVFSLPFTLLMTSVFLHSPALYTDPSSVHFFVCHFLSILLLPLVNRSFCPLLFSHSFFSVFITSFGQIAPLPFLYIFLYFSFLVYTSLYPLCSHLQSHLKCFSLATYCHFVFYLTPQTLIFHLFSLFLISSNSLM